MKFQKAYQAHELEYQKMKTQGIGSWDQRNQSWAIDPHDEHFLMDAFAQSWVPDKGRAIELGCGTGPLSRWLANKEFSTTGIDISPTAIQMAIDQSAEIDCQFLVDDICSLDTTRLKKFDLCLDGHLLHCITNPEDRKLALDNIRKLLKPGGVYIQMSMCSPIDAEIFATLFKNQKVVDDVIYVPAGNSVNCEEIHTFEGAKYLPTRYLGHWHTLLDELRTAGFLPKLIRYNQCGSGDPVSSLNVAAQLS